MAITSVQKAALEEVLQILVSTTAPRNKRQLAGMFLDLVDRAEWPEYFDVIPEPRCLNNIRASIEKNRYKDAMDAYTDLSLVFWNALFYNEPDSQIALDAATLKGILETEWKKRSVLPIPRISPPPSSPQKVHKTPLDPSPPTSTPVATPAITPVPPAPAATTAPTPNISTGAVAGPSSGLLYVQQKPVPIRPRSPAQAASPEMDIDVAGMTPEPEGQTEDLGVVDMERDPESEELVRQLEKGLPRWDGFGELGWMPEIDPDRYVEIIHSLKSHKDVVGNRLAVALETVPEEPSIPNLSYTLPLSLKSIEAHARVKDYATSKDFDMDMARLFEKARRWHEPATEPYGRVLLLQRLYQALTSASPPPGPPYNSATNFASLRAGPGNAKPLHTSDADGVAGVTTYRVPAKDRTFVEEVHYKGWSVRLADWLHLSNPDDPSRPIVAQVFKCWISEEPSKKGQPGLTACWYHRPEQTFHPAHRQFWEGEVFKTSHFADHPLEDLIEKIACQFTARHIRGRPRPPYWWPGFPLYVCDSRYNDRERVFVKIKNWNSCVPEEVRKSTEFMPIYPFERTVFPRRFGSPFLTKSGKSPVKGPGGIVESTEKAEAEKAEVAAPGTGRKRPRRVGAADAGPSKGLYVGVPGAQGTGTTAVSGFQYQHSNLPQQGQVSQRLGGQDRSVITAAGGLATLGHNPQVEKLPTETAKHFDRDPETNEVLWFAAPPLNVARPPALRHSLAYLHFLAMKRKQASNGDEVMDVDADTELPLSKRMRTQIRPSVTETLGAVLKELAQAPT